MIESPLTNIKTLNARGIEPGYKFIKFNNVFRLGKGRKSRMYISLSPETGIQAGEGVGLDEGTCGVIATTGLEEAAAHDEEGNHEKDGDDVGNESVEHAVGRAGLVHRFIVYIIILMGDPVKYLTLVTEVLELYQQELISQFKKSMKQAGIDSNKELKAFMKTLNEHVSRLKEVEQDKGIHDDRVSDACRPMSEYLVLATRPSRTSQSERYAIRASLMSQEGNRMRFTGGLRKSPPLTGDRSLHQNTIEESQSQIEDIIHSYRIQDELVPRMRMKWKSLKHDLPQGPKQKQQKSTIGDNNIDLLSYTIPEIQNSIKRLSLQSRENKSHQRSPDRTFELYRTVDTRSHNRKKYVPRLI